MAAQAGIVYYDSRPVSSQVINTLRHGNSRLGPDGVGSYVVDGIAMLSFASHFDRLAQLERQPVCTPASLFLTWDGRLDNREDLLVRLGSDAAADPTDAGLIAFALQRWGEDVLNSLVGDWSLACWFSPRRELVLARDYLGTRPLYYCARADYFVWSTALEPLVRVCSLEGALNDTYMAGWLTFAPPEHETYYREVFQVPAGHVLQVRPRHASIARPFASFPSHTVRYSNRTAYEDHYRSSLIDAVKSRLRARAPVWVELSGGYDSSSITCVASSLIRAGAVEAPSLQPVSVVMPSAPESDESSYIQSVEHFCQLEGVRLPFAERFDLNPLPTSVTHDASPALRITVDAASDSGSHVMLSGELGDAITMPFTAHDVLLGHIRRLQFAHLFADTLRHCRSSRESILSVWLSLLRALIEPEPDPLKKRLVTLKTMADARRLASPDDEAQIFGLRHDFLKHSLTTHTAVKSHTSVGFDTEHILARAIHHANTQGGFAAMQGNSPLRMTFPFAHRPLVEFILALPPQVVWSPEHPRAFICSALRDVLPPAIIARRTKSNAPPAVSRYLIPAVVESLGAMDTWQLVVRGYADAPTLADILKAFVDGSQSTAVLVRRLLEGEALLRRHFSTPRLPLFASDADSPVETGVGPLTCSPTAFDKTRQIYA